MKDDSAAGQIVALQIRVEDRQLVGQHHALVANRVRRQGDHVEVGKRGAQLLFGASAGEEQRKGEAIIVVIAARIDEDLLDARQGVAGQLSADAVVGGRHAPALDGGARALEFGFERVAASRRVGFIMWQEYQAGREMRAECDAGFLRERAEEGFGFADEQAAAVAGQAVGGDAAAMGHARERGNRGVDECARRLIVKLRDHAETAGIAFVVRVVQSRWRAALAAAKGHRSVPRIFQTEPPCPAPQRHFEMSPDARLKHSCCGAASRIRRSFAMVAGATFAGFFWSAAQRRRCCFSGVGNTR